MGLKVPSCSYLANYFVAISSDDLKKVLMLPLQAPWQQFSGFVKEMIEYEKIQV